MYNILFVPSFYAHVGNGFFLLIAFLLLFMNYSKIIKLEPYKMIILTLVLSIGMGIHGLSHSYLEKNYNYNPMNVILR